MNPTPIVQLLEKSKDEFTFSGYQLYAEQAGEVCELFGGVTSYWTDSESVRADTYFDIGSVTKAVVTTSLCARAVQSKKLDLQTTVGHYLPNFLRSKYESLSVKDLLSHSSGLVGWYPIYRERGALSLSTLLLRDQDKICVAEKGQRAVYSDVGFLILGLILEAIGGPLDQQFENEVRDPLELCRIQYGPIENLKEVAATEYSAERGLIHGAVFDDNCFSLNHICSHAGLFSSAAALAPFCREWLRAREGKSPWLNREVALQFTTGEGRIPKSSWALGWDTKSPTGSSAGDFFSNSSFGHLGFPGCSIWMDPELAGFAVFLTNRVHPSRLDERIRRLRPQLHNLIAQQWRNHA